MTLAGRLRQGRALIALKADVAANVGAYSCFPTTCGVEPLMAMAELPGPYDFRAYECRARGVLTNTCTMAPYRGVSRPVLTFALERAMDKAAAAFGLEPVDIRRRNLIDKFPLHLADRPGVRRGELQADPGAGGAGTSTCPPSARGSRKRAPRAAISASASPPFSERTGYGSAGFRRARHGDHARLGDR